MSDNTHTAFDGAGSGKENIRRMVQAEQEHNTKRIEHVCPLPPIPEDDVPEATPINFYVPDADGSYMVPTGGGGARRVYPHPGWKPGDYVRNPSRGNYTGRILRVDGDGHSGVDIFRDDGEWTGANAEDLERVSADEGRELRAATAAKAEVRADTLRTAIAQLQTMLNLELRVIKMIQSSEDTN